MKPPRKTLRFEPFGAGRFIVGESPFWSNATSRISVVDIPSGLVRELTVSGELVRDLHLDESVGSAVPRRRGGFVLATASGFKETDFSGQVSRNIGFLQTGERMNDAKVGPDGGFWSGSCATNFEAGKGRLWRMDASGEVVEVSTGFSQPNGMAWDKAGTAFFLVDSKASVVLKATFAPGELPNFDRAEVVLDKGSFIGEPDGMVIDCSDNLWIAEYGAGVVSCFSSDGQLLDRVATPTQFPTSLTFAGRRLNRLLITSASQDAVVPHDSMSGRTFLSAPLQVRGMDALLFDNGTD